MEPPDVQLLVHISATCGARDDARYRKEAHNLLAFLAQSPAITPIPPVDQRDFVTESGEGTRSSATGDETTGTQKTPARVADTESICQPGRSVKRRMIRSKSDAAIEHRKTPEIDAVVQVGRTPAWIARETPLERPKTAPAMIKETPLGPLFGATDAHPHFTTPPSTVPDSQPSHSAFKRAFMECATAAAHAQLDTPLAPARPRARTAPPVPPWFAPGNSGDSSHSQPTIAAAMLRPLKRRFGMDGNNSSPSPPKRRRVQAEPQPLLSSSNSGVQADIEPSSSLSNVQPVIHEDEDANAQSSTFAPLSTSNEPHDSLPLRSSQSSQNRQSSQPEAEGGYPLQPHETSKDLNTGPIDIHIPDAPALASTPTAPQQPPPASSPQLSSNLITSPRPATGVTPFQTHLTSALSLVRSKLVPLSKYYAPTSQCRTIAPLERGCWRFDVPESWMGDGTRDTFWQRLSEHIRKGRAGFGTWIERSSDKNSSFTETNGTDALEAWRIWCWGEVVVEIWLLLYVDSGGKVRNLPMRWEDGEGRTVVKMGEG